MNRLLKYTFPLGCLIVALAWKDQTNGPTVAIAALLSGWVAAVIAILSDD